MKRNYINPKTTYVKVELEQLIAESLEGDGLDGTSNGGKTSTQNITDADVKGEAGWASGW
ncbi:MAG: hypothetical protein KBT39_00275 [Bacteroidales bacterium]|nr:hypothetical protein [Bacteroidales bacterium]